MVIHTYTIDSVNAKLMLILCFIDTDDFTKQYSDIHIIDSKVKTFSIHDHSHDQIYNIYKLKMVNKYLYNPRTHKYNFITHDIFFSNYFHNI